MAVVGDLLRMILERFPENVRVRFNIDKCKPMTVKYTSSNSGMLEFCLSSDLCKLRQDTPNGDVAEHLINGYPVSRGNFRILVTNPCRDDR